MPLFRCTKCNGVENTALSNFWTRLFDAHTTGAPPADPLCSACDPKIGAWHGEFPQRSADGMLVDAQGHLYREDELREYFAHVKAVARVIDGHVVPLQGGR